MARTPTTQRWLAVLRYAPIVVVPALLVASTFPGRFSVPSHYWLLSMTAVGVFVAGKWWPATASVVLAALAVPMFGTEAWGPSELVPYLGAIALADAVMRRGGWPCAIAAVAWTGAVVADVVMDDHTDVWSAMSIVKVVASVAIPVLLGLYLRGQRALAASYRQRALDADARRRQEQQQTRTDERVALARELHDVVAHHMASIVLRIGVAQHVLKPHDQPVRDVLDDVKDTASHALTDIRRLLVALRDPVLGDVPLVDAEQLATEIDAGVERVRAAGFTVEAKVADPADIAGLDAIGRLTLLRVVQEALTNAMKYGDAEDAVAVTVSRADGAVEIVIGNRRGGAATGAGHGIVGMAERVDLVGGTLAVGPKGAQHWLVQARIPLADKEIDS
ncbi:two-component sensor histidine kinase [Gordonia sp. TBRC 11910]|uniref:histidine kinase n=1 Tax=Gordonia asplenii TaxID=2725283 RepID=A0A848KVK4_9ACTN|nr:histidine kinase [Gordonia asplenii]NMO02309.1 two-component sensor histidine kinase [Gordonia asplenii]